MTAVHILESHGFRAQRQVRTVLTDCPTLWAVPVLNRAIGFREMASLEVTPSPVPRAGAGIAAEPPAGGPTVIS